MSHWQLLGRLGGGGQETTPPLSEIQPKNPCPRRGPRPKTIASLPAAGGNPERLRAVSSRDRRMKRERRRPASRHGGGRGAERRRSICQTACGGSWRRVRCYQK